MMLIFADKNQRRFVLETFFIYLFGSIIYVIRRLLVCWMLPLAYRINSDHNSYSNKEPKFLYYQVFAFHDYVPDDPVDHCSDVRSFHES